MGLLSKVFGGSKSSSKNDPSSVWGAQTPYLAGLYQRAQNASLGMGSGGWGQQSPYQPAIQQQMQQGTRRFPNTRQGRIQQQMQGWQQQQAPAAAPSASQGYDPLSGLGQSLTQQGMGMLGNLGMLGQAGSLGSSIGQGMLGNLGMLGQAGNPFAMAQIDQLGQGMGRMYQQYIAPTINSQFAGGGSLGGSRQALGLGQAAEGLGQSYTSGALDILGNSSQLALQANAAGLGGLNDSSQLALQANAAGLAGLGDVFSAGNAGVFGSLPMLANLLGGPTVLGGGGTSSQRQNGAILQPLKLF